MADLELDTWNENIIQFPPVQREIGKSTESVISDTAHHVNSVVKAPKTWAFKWPYWISYKGMTVDVLDGILFNGEREWVANIEESSNYYGIKLKKRYLKHAKKTWKKHIAFLKKGMLPEDVLRDLEEYAPHMVFNFWEILEKDREKYSELYNIWNQKQESWRRESEKQAA